MKWILLLSVVLIALSIAYGESEERWSGCWTLFPADSTICKSEFGTAYENVRSEGCGLGKRILCRNKYPGCEPTVCYSALIPRSELCKRSFGNRLPVTRGGFEDCTPGFYRSRCCAT